MMPSGNFKDIRSQPLPTVSMYSSADPRATSSEMQQSSNVDDAPPSILLRPTQPPDPVRRPLTEMSDGLESSTSGHTTPRIRLSRPTTEAGGGGDGNERGDDDDTRSVEPMYAESDAECESPPTRVHFRSRVRIASGLNRHRHELSSDLIAFSAASSRSCSPSSSISAPLRSAADDDVGRPGWGTLGQRVSLFAQGRHRRQGSRAPDEHSPLLTTQPAPCLRAYPTKNIDDDNENWDSDLSTTRWLKQQIVSVICCHCLAESDDEHP